MRKIINILITGGAGFIGSNLALKLIDKGYKVTVLDNLSPQIHGANPKKTSPLYQSIIEKVNFIEGTVMSHTDWKKSLVEQDVVVHLAAETGTGQSMYEIEKYTNVNIGGTAILLDILTNSNHNIKKVVVASSRAIYGEGKYICDKDSIVYPLTRNDLDMLKKDFECKCPKCGNNVQLCPTDEYSKIHPTSVYGITKQVQEELVLVCCRALGIPAISFRYQNVYGPGQSLKNSYTGILSIFSTCLINNKPINIFEDGTESRDFVYIDDVVNATVKGIESELNDCISINVGTGVATNVLSVAETLKGLYKSQSEIIISGKYRIGDIRHNIADITLAEQKLGFTPEICFFEGIKRFVTWVNGQAIETNSYEESIEEMKKRGLYK